jgi:ABC-2 type transport system ATP-binding protein
MTAVETVGLTRRFRDVTAVDDPDLAVESGAVFGVLGPNGAGKSTTIDVLLGSIAPTAGTARVLGHDVTGSSRAVRQRRGLLPEGSDFYENPSGRRHVVSAIETTDAADDPDELARWVVPADAARLTMDVDVLVHQPTRLQIFACLYRHGEAGVTEPAAPTTKTFRRAAGSAVVVPGLICGPSNERI